MAERDRAGMTGWYDKGLLITAVRVISSTWFEQLFDRRDLMAALDPLEREDFEKQHCAACEGDLWFDYVADLGDGWRPTHAVARLLARPRLEVEDPAGASMTLNRGALLVMGGDQVYPWPSIGAYKSRLEAPYEAANIAEGGGYNPETTLLTGKPQLYAIPGNHDWYDGLTAFAYRFCARRPRRDGRSLAIEGHAIAGRETRQTRSYFARRLPGKWWIVGIDVQLGGWIDDEQNAFFHYVAQCLMDPGSNIVVCAPNPEWSYLREGHERENFEAIAYVLSIISGDVTQRDTNRILATYRFRELPDPKNPRRHHVRLVLAGDSHHYARWIEGDPSPDADTENRERVQYIVCGLGGAFLHPTHALPAATSIEMEYAAPSPAPLVFGPVAKRPIERTFTRVAEWPPGEISSGMTWLNLFMGFYNKGFSAITAAVSLLLAWHLVGNQDALDLPMNSGPAGSTVQLITRIFLLSPGPLIFVFCLYWAMIYFCDFEIRWKRAIAGFLHATAHVAGFLFAFALSMELSAHWSPGCLQSLFDEPTARGATVVLAMAVWGFIIPPLTLGLYLIITLQGFGVHWNEAFSSLRVEDYKGFLRMHIDAGNRLTVYPVGIEKTPRQDDGTLRPRLIDKPIVFAQIEAPPGAPKRASTIPPC